MDGSRILLAVAVVVVASTVSFLILEGGGPPSSGAVLGDNLDLVGSHGGPGLLIPQCANDTFLVESSDVVAMGVVSRLQQLRAENDLDRVLVVISVEQYLKGSGPRSINMRIPATLYDAGYTLSALEDVPDFALEERLQLYLRKLEGAKSHFGEPYSVVCGHVGKKSLSPARPGPYVGPAR